MPLSFVLLISFTVIKAQDKMMSLEGWPARPTLAVKVMTVKYGSPTELTTEKAVWHNAGPYKRIMVTRKKILHDFPTPHMDFLEHTVAYNVPTDKVDDLVAFNASMTINKTAGEMSARCDLEGHNILTLNLARDIINGTKTVQQARTDFGKNVVDDFMGKHPAYVENLQFTPPTSNVMFADQPVIPGSALRDTLDAKAGTDAEVLSFVNAVNLNEILAAAEAEKKKISDPVMSYAKMLHMEHGKNMDQTMKLGIAINTKPADTRAVDEMKQKGAGELGMIVTLNGSEFEKAYIDMMIKGHTEALSLIDNQLMNQAKNAALKKHLTNTRSHVAMHLEQAKKLKGSM